MSLLDDAPDPSPAEETSLPSSPSDRQAEASPSSEEKPWFDGLPEDLVTDKVKRFGSQEDLLKSYNEAQKLISSKGLQPPADDASEEEVEAFYKSIGRPDSVDGYKYEIPEESYLDDETVGLYKDAALKAGATPKQFKSMMDSVNASIAADAERQEQEAKAQSEAARGLLEKEWGKNYKDNIKAIKGTMEKFGVGEDTMKAFSESGLGSNVEFVKFLNHITKAMGESTVSSQERLAPSGDHVKNLKAARDAETDPIKYDQLHKQYMDAKARLRGVI